MKIAESGKLKASMLTPAIDGKLVKPREFQFILLVDHITWHSFSLSLLSLIYPRQWMELLQKLLCFSSWGQFISFLRYWGLLNIIGGGN